MSPAPTGVTIFDHAGEEHCHLCGEDDTALIAAHPKREHGDDIQVQHVDLAESPGNGAVTKKTRTENIPLPVAAIDGVLKLSATVEHRAIMEAIEVQKEVRLWKRSMM